MLSRNDNFVLLSVMSLLAFRENRMRGTPPPHTHHPPVEEPHCRVLHSIVMETKEGKMAEIYDSPFRHEGVKRQGG